MRSDVRPGPKVGIYPPIPKELVTKPELDGGRRILIQFDRVVPADTGVHFTPILEDED